MIPRIKEDLLAMLRAAIIAIKEQNFSALAELSNHSIHNASIYQDEDSLSAAVLIYALSKILSRSATIPSGKAFCGDIIKELTSAVQTLEQDREDALHEQLKHLLRHIMEMDSSLRKYITEVITQAEIKKGSRLYEHGFSLSTAAAMLGVTQWELQSYIGHTTMTEENEGIDIRSRIQFARSLFE